MSQAVLRLENLAPGTYSIRFIDFVITVSSGNFWVESTTLTVSTQAPNGNLSQVGLIIGGTTVSVDQGQSGLSCWSYIDVHASGLTYTVYDDGDPTPKGGGSYVNGFWAGDFSLLLAENGVDVFEEVVLILNIDDVGDAAFPGGSPPTVPANFAVIEDGDDVAVTWDADADAWTNIEMSIYDGANSTPWVSVAIAPPTVEAATVNGIEDTILNGLDVGTIVNPSTNPTGENCYEVYFRAKGFLAGSGVSAYSLEDLITFCFGAPPVPPEPTFPPIDPPAGPGPGPWPPPGGPGTPDDTGTDYEGYISFGGTATIAFVVDPSGMYTIVTNKRHDTLYERTDIDEQDVKIPNPFVITGYLG